MIEFALYSPLSHLRDKVIVTDGQVYKSIGKNTLRFIQT